MHFGNYCKVYRVKKGIHLLAYMSGFVCLQVQNSSILTPPLFPCIYVSILTKDIDITKQQEFQNQRFKQQYCKDSTWGQRDNIVDKVLVLDFHIMDAVRLIQILVPPGIIPVAQQCVTPNIANKQTKNSKYLSI